MDTPIQEKVRGGDGVASNCGKSKGRIDAVNSLSLKNRHNGSGSGPVHCHTPDQMPKYS